MGPTAAALLFTGHVTQPNFGPKSPLKAFKMAMSSSISRVEQLKLETSNLAGRLNIWIEYNRKNAKLG